MTPSKRPEMPGGRARSIRVRVSEEEHATLTRLAAEEGVSVGQFVMGRALAEGPSPRAVAVELMAIRRGLHLLESGRPQSGLEARLDAVLEALS